MLNSSEIFTSSQYFTEYDLSNCEQKLNTIVKNVKTKKEEQTALVTRNSTDLSVTQEALRLTQVANLALQQQVGEKNQLINAGAITLQTTQSQLTTSQNQNQQKDTQITQLNNDLTTTRNQVGQLNTQIVTKDNQINNKEQAIKQKEEILRAKEKEIIELRTKLGLLSPEEVLKNKISLKKRELDSIVRGLSLNRQTVVSLCDAYENNVDWRL